MNEGRLRHAWLLFTAKVRRKGRRTQRSLQSASTPHKGHKSHSQPGITLSHAQHAATSGSTLPSRCVPARTSRSEEHTSELQSLMRISYAVFCLKKKNIQYTIQNYTTNDTNK